MTLAAEIIEGPYWLDLNLVRPDIREDRKGVTLQLSLNVVDIATGKPIRDASVDIWHCDADGVYSGFAGASVAANGAGGAAVRVVRAVRKRPTTAPSCVASKLTDASGKARFTTIYRVGTTDGRSTSTSR